ncbi:hypothetical protein B0T25DRAFT_565560 [Lasiosphaeria hispida]|uniref:Major facilitator superfamily (MFS) profile domain-containing protein n=1 Tax=Lasiosphaeria hispida TaxID=260671 RepID=A0AAJ0HSY1_9PEZI|nr:hypothetical protein B0T25DRAFT_565560 [Lasiosphaeria hispida]
MAVELSDNKAAPAKDSLEPKTGEIDKLSSSTDGQVAPAEGEVVEEPDFERGFGFWAIIIRLGVTTLLASLEHTVRSPIFLVSCDIFGRRWVCLINIAIFTLGSGICGGASTGNMLIAGRAIQGAGSTSLCRTCSLRKRCQYMAVILAIFGLGVAIGPFIGGVIAENSDYVAGGFPPATSVMDRPAVGPCAQGQPTPFCPFQDRCLLLPTD